MKGSEDQALKDAIKQLIIEESEREMEIEDLGDEAALFGETSPIQLDSLDALQVSMALQKRYNVSFQDPKELRRVMVSVNAVADYIQPE